MYEDFGNAWYTPYRPIYCSVDDSTGDVAYMRAELELETGFGTNVFLGTGIMIAAYQASDSNGNPIPGRFQFNIMGYVREFFSQSGAWAGFPNASGIYIWGWEQQGRFRLNIWAMRYNPVAGGPLLNDVSGNVETKPFFALATTTDATQNFNSNWPSTYDTLDALILGSNALIGGTDEASYLLNQGKPHFTSPGDSASEWEGNWTRASGSKSYTINVADFQSDAIYLPYNMTSHWHEVWVIIQIIDLNGNIGPWHTLQLADIGSASTTAQLYTIPCHPHQLAFWIFGLGGSFSNEIVVGGNLVSKGAVIAPLVEESVAAFGPKMQRHGKDNVTTTPNYIDWSDESLTNGKCNRNKFVWKNRGGGFDWINIYGTESKETKFDSTLFDHRPGMFSAQHKRKVIYNNREDTFTVVSQPVSNEIALHIEGLLTSTMVWIHKDRKQMSHTGAITNGSLVPILISPNSYTIYNTEDNVNFVEFSYTFSEQITMQKG